MLMKYMRGAEAISIFKPTDSPSTSFCLAWLGWCGEVWRGDGERVGQWVFWGGFFFFFFPFLPASLLHLNQSVNTSVWLRRRMVGGCLVGDVNKTAIHCWCKQSWDTAIPLCRYPPPTPPTPTPHQSPHSTPKKSVSYKRVGKLEREHKWFTGSLTPRGPRRSVGAAGEMLNMQRRSCQLAAGRRRLAPLTALVGADIFNRIPYAPNSSTPAAQCRQPSSAEPEIRLGLIHTALYLLSTSHYAPCCREEGFFAVAYMPWKIIRQQPKHFQSQQCITTSLL